MDNVAASAPMVTTGNAPATGSSGDLKRFFLYTALIVVVSGFVGGVIYYFTQADKLTYARKVGKQLTFNPIS